MNNELTRAHEVIMSIETPKPNTVSESELSVLLYAEQLAERFHNTYEKLAPDFGYKTREASSVSWNDVPENNKKLMIATCKTLIEQGV